MIFTTHNHSLAELVIPARASAFGVRTSGGGADPLVHEVGVEGSPRWRLSMSLDDEWELDTLTHGRLLSGDAPGPEYLKWAEGTRAENGFGVLAALPTGRYFVARSELSPQREARVLLGNERLPTPANVLTLLDRSPFYSLAIGALLPEACESAVDRCYGDVTAVTSRAGIVLAWTNSWWGRR